MLMSPSATITAQRYSIVVCPSVFNTINLVILTEVLSLLIQLNASQNVDNYCEIHLLLHIIMC